MVLVLKFQISIVLWNLNREIFAMSKTTDPGNPINTEWQQKYSTSFSPSPANQKLRHPNGDRREGVKVEDNVLNDDLKDYPTCTISIMVARTDLPFMMHTIPHLMRMCDFPFVERVLFVDTAPLSGEKVNRPGVGSMEQLRECCDRLLKSGVVDKVVDMDYSASYRDRIYRKHFGAPISSTHNYKGYPILGSIFSIEEVQGDYMLHFDSDMLLYQQPGYNWVLEGIKLLQKHPEVMAVRPLTGPPTYNGSIHQSVPYDRDPDGFYRFKFFSSRAFLIDRKRFDSLLPLPVMWRSYKNTILNRLPTSVKTSLNCLTGKGLLDSWELMVSKRLEETSYIRAALESPQAWTIHPKERGPEFIEALPKIIEKIEMGWYPTGQSGHYDLIFKDWLEELANDQTSMVKNWGSQSQMSFKHNSERTKI